MKSWPWLREHRVKKVRREDLGMSIEKLNIQGRRKKSEEDKMTNKWP